MSSRTRSLKPLSVARVLYNIWRTVRPSEWVRQSWTDLKVSLRIFSLTSQGPRPTYSKNVSADMSCTRSSIFHILGRSVGS